VSKLNSFNSNQKSTTQKLFLSTSFLLIVSIVLTVLPVPEMVKWVWPQWVLLALIYRIVTKPSQYGIFFGFLVGLIIDLLLSHKLGVHALSYSVICYFMLKMQHKIYLFPVAQHSLVIFLLVLFDSALIMLFSNAELNWIFIGRSVLSAMSTAIIWVFTVVFVGLRQELSKM
jgi:rod shape-determining protein MreD